MSMLLRIQSYSKDKTHELLTPKTEPAFDHARMDCAATESHEIETHHRLEQGNDY
ncbi:hypothetical protein PGTUg99_012180, partial [Puccinia graminis f. sp. tritici]